MLLAYDERLALLLDRLADVLAPGARTSVAAVPALATTLTSAMRATGSDGALVVLLNASGDPRVESVGLSEWETARIVEIGFATRQGARAVEIAYAPDDLGDGAARDPIRSGLAVPVPDRRGSVVAAFFRAPDATFGDEDVVTLERAAGQLARGDVEHPAGPPSSLDQLTGLYDRHTFHALLAREGSLTDLHGTPLTVVMLDVDRLGILNQQLGPARADAALVAVAQRLRTVLPEAEGFACRIGGGRFGLILKADEPAAADLFARLQRSLAADPPVAAEAISLSAGIAVRQASEGAPSLITRADAALGLAKGSGPGAVASALAS